MKQLDLSAVAPFCGLFGTVLGIVYAFRFISAEKATGFTAVGTGIGVAVVATAVALLAPMPLVWLFNRADKAKK